MPWASVDDFKESALYKSFTEMHGWASEKLTKFVSAFGEVFARAKRNGADDEKAHKLAFPIAFHVAKRAASADTLAKVETNVHYVAAMARHQVARDFDSAKLEAEECKFTVLQTSMPLMKALVAGVAPNWEHNPEHQIGVIRDIVRFEDAPSDVRAAADPATPFFFVASYRTDVPEESRKELKVSAEWVPLGGGEVLPFNFAKSHAPLNGPELGILQVAALLADEPEKPADADDKTKVAAQSPKTYQDSQGSTRPGAPKMADPKPEDAGNSGSLEVRVASLSTALEAEKVARVAAESKLKTQEDLAKDLQLKYAALKEQADKDHAAVVKMAEDALDREAGDAALQLVRDGKCAADKVSDFKQLYKDIGQARFAAMAKNLPGTLVGVGEAKAHADGQPPTALNDATRDSLKVAAQAAMRDGRA